MARLHDSCMYLGFCSSSVILLLVVWDSGLRRG